MRMSSSDYEVKFYNRQGKEITLKEFGELHRNLEYKRVFASTLPDGRWLSTVWIGINHRFFGDGPPLIFETMLFSHDGPGESLNEWRFATEQEALLWHEIIFSLEKGKIEN